MRLKYLYLKPVCAAVLEGRPGGFTLIELIITVAIAGILSSMAIPLYKDYIEKARIVRTVSEIITISKSIAVYNIDNNRFPETLDEVGQRSLLDTWGAPYQYLNIQTMGRRGRPRKDKFVHPINSNFDLYSMGKDGMSRPALTAKASKDDVIWANDGAYVGIASAF